MPFTIDYRDEAVLEWSTTASGATCREVTDYRPTIYVSAPTRTDLETIQGFLDRRHGVVQTCFERWRTGFRHDPEPVLRIDVTDLNMITTVAHELQGWGDPGTYKCYNVDFSREFRYCLENDITPVPEADLTRLSLTAPEPELAARRLTTLTVGDDEIDGTEREILDEVEARVHDIDPDVLIVSASDILPTLYGMADSQDRSDFHLGRRPGFEQLASASTYTSYGRVGHSPARYNLPGRVIIDQSNTFMWDQTNLDGCLDLVRRSGKPLQELAWASIGRILTAIQIQAARERNVLVPWKSWRHEFFKSMRTLDAADRGGFTFAPEVGLHEDVRELDFSSLYPNIIVTRNISPETIRCECHREREDVPDLGYCICDKDGYLPAVLEPLIDARDRIKADLHETDDPDHRAELEGKSDALKWILVSCFGYQGFSNAKFGRIECHEAITAFARELLLDAKAVLEANGWRILHGIVDSVWVTPRDGAEQTPLRDLCAQLSDRFNIRLEYEAAYDWLAFVPQRNSDAGALTKYFGKVDGADEFKIRGIEARQRSTPAYIERVQRELLKVLDEQREPEAVCDQLDRERRRLQQGEIDPDKLVLWTRTSKQREAYTHETRMVAALERAAILGLERAPGQDVRYVVVDDEAALRDRVRLACEPIDEYDSTFYTTQLLRAGESVLSPLGWTRPRIEGYLATDRTLGLGAFD